MTFFSLTLLTKTVAAALSSVSFSVVFGIKKKHLVYATGISTIAYFVYYTVLYFEGTLFLAAFLSTALAAFFSEILARVRHAPAIVFLLPAVIPTVPGGAIYYAMRDLLSNNPQGSLENLLVTLKIALGIAGGIVSVSVIFTSLFRKIKKIKKKNVQ